MEDLTRIIFKVTNDTFGYPDPFIADGTAVIIVQDQKILLSLYQEATKDYPHPSFIHPKSSDINKEVEKELIDLIKVKHPDYLLSEVAIVITCPFKIAERIAW